MKLKKKIKKLGVALAMGWFGHILKGLLKKKIIGKTLRVAEPPHGQRRWPNHPQMGKSGWLRPLQFFLKK
jgi:hypothetical protein